jgi:hypothetical protein
VSTWTTAVAGGSGNRSLEQVVRFGVNTVLPTFQTFLEHENESGNLSSEPLGVPWGTGGLDARETAGGQWLVELRDRGFRGFRGFSGAPSGVDPWVVFRANKPLLALGAEISFMPRSPASLSPSPQSSSESRGARGFEAYGRAGALTPGSPRGAVRGSPYPFRGSIRGSLPLQMSQF